LSPGSGNVKLFHTDFGKRFRFVRTGGDVMEICFQPDAWYWGPVNVKLNRIPVGNVLVGAGPHFEDPDARVKLVEARAEADMASASWTVLGKGTEAEVHSSFQVVDRTLVVDYEVRGGGLDSLSLGRFADLRDARLVSLKGHGCPPSVLRVETVREFFAVQRVCLDSDRAGLTAASMIDSEGSWTGGEIRWKESNRGNFHARIYITISQNLSDVLPGSCRVE
jgi:hypothetical protein